MSRVRHCDAIQNILSKQSEIYAFLNGSEYYPTISGCAEFYPLWGGTLMAVTVTGLPAPKNGTCGSHFHGFHIHEGGSCEKGSSPEEPFPLARSHFNPANCPHPEHAGDLPPLLSNDGFAFQIFYTNQFVPEEVLGKTVIIHLSADDFTTQPSGNSGAMIACGEIKSVW
ncbi:MAG: superoxide dismutase family protein [Lachnospiraceae bacterium]|nr:superoxide dismutase family protein [Lachnospiraceae bacterium]